MDLWVTIVGLISAEVFGHFGSGTLRDPGEFFLRSVGRALRGIFDGVPG